jgi:hypothetical protein
VLSCTQDILAGALFDLHKQDPSADVTWLERELDNELDRIEHDA